MAEYIEREANAFPLCKDNVICCNDDCRGCANAVYRAYIKRRIKSGRWVISSDGYYPYCSGCGNEPKHGEMTNFCPNCGADMRGRRTNG